MQIERFAIRLHNKQATILQHLLNINFHVRGRNHRFKPQDGLTVLGDEKLAKVPTDGIALVEACAGLLVDLVKHSRKLLGAF